MKINVTIYNRKLRSSEQKKILIHMSFSLIGLYVTFFIASLLGQFYGGLSPLVREPFCIGFAATVQYFFLVYFFITVAQSVLLYLKLVRVMGTEDLMSQFQLKVGIVCWSK